MWADEVLSKLSSKKEYNREDLLRIFQAEKRDLSESAFRWMLYALLYNQKLFKIDYNTYVTDKPYIRPQYKPSYSDKANSLMNDLICNYPDMGFVIFESALLNEFLDNQIEQNTVFIQVDKNKSLDLFETIRDAYKGSVLYRPTIKEFDKYWTKDCIVVLDLISQAPLSHTDPHSITAEKMIVDLLAERSMGAIFNSSELPDIYDKMIGRYNVDIRKMNRYAGRRGKTEEIKMFQIANK